MKTNTITYLLLVLLLLMAACTDWTTDETMAAKMPVAFVPVIDGGRPVTRTSTLDNEWTAGMEVAVRDKSNSSVLKYNIQSDGSTLRPASLGAATNDYWWSGAEDATTFWWPSTEQTKTFDAWCEPGGSYSATQPASISVAANQSVYNASTNPSGIKDAVYQSYDVLYAPEVTTDYKQTVALTFYHQMARVVVTVNSALTEEAQSVTGVTFGNSNIYRTGSISKWAYTGSTGAEKSNATTWGSLTNASTITMRLISTDTANKVYIYECMVPPQSGGSASTPLITVTTTPSPTGEEVGRPEDTYTLKQTYDMTAGYQYNYYLVLSETGKIIVTSVKVNDWATIVNVSGSGNVPNAGY